MGTSSKSEKLYSIEMMMTFEIGNIKKLMINKISSYLTLFSLLDFNLIANITDRMPEMIIKILKYIIIAVYLVKKKN